MHPIPHADGVCHLHGRHARTSLTLPVIVLIAKRRKHRVLPYFALATIQSLTTPDHSLPNSKVAQVAARLTRVTLRQAAVGHRAARHANLQLGRHARGGTQYHAWLIEANPATRHVRVDTTW